MNIVRFTASYCDWQYFQGFQGVCLAKVKIWVLYLLNLPSFYFISHTFCIGIEQCITWRDKAAIQSPLKKGDEGALLKNLPS
jgi:hypothetical protein